MSNPSTPSLRQGLCEAALVVASGIFDMVLARIADRIGLDEVSAC